LSGTQFSTFNSAGINDPEGPEKYNTEVKINVKIGFKDVERAQNFEIHTK
jgi:hypothetical protein